MRFRYLVIAVIAFIAYTYGAKAGTGRYKEISNYLGSFWNDPKVQKARKAAKKDVLKARKAAVKKAHKLGR
jgi:Asp/Glu/hydantoin racemase